jgi:hypothetical protein
MHKVLRLLGHVFLYTLSPDARSMNIICPMRNKKGIYKYPAFNNVCKTSGDFRGV